MIICHTHTRTHEHAYKHVAAESAPKLSPAPRRRSVAAVGGRSTSNNTYITAASLARVLDTSR